jgi:hypothetical protein
VFAQHAQRPEANPQHIPIQKTKKKAEINKKENSYTPGPNGS